MAAEICFAQGLTRRYISGETIRQVLSQLGVSWKRAEPWITSPDPAYVRKKTVRSPDPAGLAAPQLGAGLGR